MIRSMKKEMELFEFRKLGLEILRELKASAGNSSNIRLRIDIQMGDLFFGNAMRIKESIKEIAFFFLAVLHECVVHIEISNNGIIERKIRAKTLISASAKHVHDLKQDLSLRVMADRWSGKVVENNSNETVSIVLFHVVEVIDSGVHGTPDLPFQNKRILIAEDNEINAQVFLTLLEQWGVEAVVVTNGEMAVYEVQKKQFDGVLMDIHMPVLNGNAAIKKIRTFNPTIPIIALIASSDEKDINDVLSCGSNDYLLKPVNSGRLFHLLSQYL